MGDERGRVRGIRSLESREVGVENLLGVWRRRDAWEDERGPTYWERLSEALRDLDFDFRTTCAVFSALSPNNTERLNFEDCRAAMIVFTRDGLAGLDTISFHTYPANKKKAERILMGEDPDAVLRGPKTRAMFHNIVGDPGWVTVDGHMVSAWQGRRMTMDEAGISLGQYREIQAGVEEAAAAAGLPAPGFQSTVWMAWRRLNGILYHPQLKLPLSSGVEFGL